MLARVISALCLICGLTALATAQCANVCDWDYDHCTGRSGSSAGIACECLITFCRFTTCMNRVDAKNPQCGELKFAAARVDDTAASIVRVVYVPILGAPAQLEEIITHGPADLVHSALFTNVSSEAIGAIRIGWLVVSPDPSDESLAAMSERIRLARSGDPGRSVRFTPPPISLRTVPEGSTVLFFVAETTFASGRRWQADIDHLELTALPRASRLPAATNTLLGKGALTLR